MGEDVPKRAACVLYKNRAQRLYDYLNGNSRTLAEQNILVKRVICGKVEGGRYGCELFSLHVSRASVLATSEYDRPSGTAGRKFEVKLESVGSSEQIRNAKSELEKMSCLDDIPLAFLANRK